MSDFHGIVMSVSLQDPALIETFDVIGQLALAEGALILYKVRVSPGELDTAIAALQANLRASAPGFEHGFYAHFYNDEKLMVVFRERVFRQTPDPATWGDALAYGRALGIDERQLDFAPCRFADETY